MTGETAAGQETEDRHDGLEEPEHHARTQPGTGTGTRDAGTNDGSEVRKAERNGGQQQRVQVPLQLLAPHR